ncbi:alpha-2Da adrenergic receptor-like [Stylophora pistillata]|uniref:alpha-2Da adrenergic receptor-like n=1 Tax=Stylophora pistillata TaxID=50429 RepID=UPI000C04EEF6|nr:alpha-2Da adrenergic receptor-like [Stylophora pistillata]XP_022793890.1 alpha-2Da adrenergic receptor-like [Stylophora pistillata]XP_022793891.1 alpha-2Da adrenergic receptor-like [Stylophora pistillata]XP_022793892.1 alpha-2Da adrenergic receptor-like [Stylophora pistillata]XP_022793893.1 alpha-2Da adrenergic receptor-like [Stylophora pistillata]XP_022793894.1 alpha-2Da adrenergic receptor-like [Stylophora pistillata]XP_022793895.1 alpha-2Da adrenergic receptor-like [Stylophora pistillat
MDVHSQVDSAVIITTFVILSTIGLFIIVINGFVVYLVCTRQYLKTVTNFCLASLAISDILTGLYAIPLIIACSIHYNFYICVAMDLGQRFLSISTVLHLLLITLERYFTIVFSVMRTTSVMSRKTCVVTLLVVWLTSLCASLSQISFIPDPKQAPGQSQLAIAYDFVCLAVLAVIPLVIMGVAYFHIFYTQRKHCERIKRDVSPISSQCTQRNAKKERKALVIYSAMICVFIIGWFNYFFNSLQDDLGNKTGIPLWADVILLILRFSTGLLNPLLYTFLKQDFRRARKSICASRKRTWSYRRSTFTSSLSNRRTGLSTNSFAESQQMASSL